MRFTDYLRLSFRNIRRQKLRSSLTIFAVVIGVMSVTIMLSLVTGAKGFFLQQVEANGTLQQVAISQKADLADFERAGDGGPCDSCVNLDDSIVEKVKALPHVTGVARQLDGGNFEAIQYDTQKLTLNRLQAHDANGIIKSIVLAGREIKASDTDGVITITNDYANKWGFKGKYDSLIGKEVSLISRNYYTGVGANIMQPQEGQNGGGQPQGQVTTLKAKIVGITESGEESGVVNVPLAWASGMNTNQRYEPVQAQCQSTGPCNSKGTYKLVTEDMVATNGYSSLIAKVDNSKNAGSVATEIRKLGVGAADAKASIQSQLTIFNIIGLVLGGIGGIALAVAAIGVVNTMIMAILERTREIGVMRAVGSTKSTVRKLFTSEAAMLGFMGGVVGVSLGFVLTRIANVFVNKQLASNSVTARNIIGLPLWLIVLVVSLATLIGLLAGLYPAARAARLDPVEALRYE